MDRISMTEWIGERVMPIGGESASWFARLSEELAPEFHKPLTLPRAWWAMLSCAHLAGCGVGEAAALLCKMLGTVYLCPQLRLLDRKAEEELVRNKDHVPTVQECARHPAAMVDSMEEFTLGSSGWERTDKTPELPIA